MEIQKTLSTPKPASKTAFLKTRNGKCHRPSGTLHRNPYLNFLREFRLRNTGLSAVEIIRRGAREWRSMPKEDKLQFIEEAFYAPKKRKPPPPPPPAPIPAQPTQMRVTPFQDACIVCPNPCARKRRRRKARCARRRRPKRRRCARKRRPKRRGCKRRKRKSCRI